MRTCGVSVTAHLTGKAMNHEYRTQTQILMLILRFTIQITNRWTVPPSVKKSRNVFKANNKALCPLDIWL